jgi:hypothetical protein
MSMLFHSLIGVSLTLISFTAFAQTFPERVAQTYLQTDKNFDIDCSYSYNKTLKLITPVGDTNKGPNHIAREFLIEGNDRQLPMSFTLTRSSRGLEYQIVINKEHVSSAKLTRRSFYIAPIKDQAFASQFETSKIECQVNFAYALPYVLKDGNYHISVHPHKTYDWQSRLKGSIESYLNDPGFQSIILLETGNYRGELVNINQFLDGVDYKLPPTKLESDLVHVPNEVPILVSPAGNSRYDIQAKNEINITFTGGNHNYCIWNVTRHVIENLMNSNSEARVNFNYDMKAIVAQPKGIEGEGLVINFNRRDVNRSNLLKDLLSNKEIQARYHASYLQYFRDFIGKQYSGMYKTYRIHYKAEGFETTVILKGQGIRNLEINLNYI